MILTNEIGKQNNGKTQYALRYEEGENFNSKFSETQDLNIHIVRKFGIENEREFIGFAFKKYIEILAIENLNVLNRGAHSFDYPITEPLYKNYIDISKKIYGMSHLDVYDTIIKKTEIEKVFALKKIYHNHNKRFNYYTEKEWTEIRKSQILNKEIENND